MEEGIPIIWNSILTELKGDLFLKSVMIHNNETGEDMEKQVNGLFIAVGEVPNSSVSQTIGAKVDVNHYIIVDKDQKTNINGVYAAGDITGGVNQLVVSCGEGAVAAVNAYIYIKLLK